MILMPKGPENKSLLMIQKAHTKKTTTNFFLSSKECIITTTSFQVNCEENSVRVKSARKLQKSEVFQFEFCSFFQGTPFLYIQRNKWDFGDKGLFLRRKTHDGKKTLSSESLTFNNIKTNEPFRAQPHK